MNIALLVVLIMKKATFNKRQLKIWDGRGFIPVNLKPGEIDHTWKRPDGTSVTFHCTDEWGHPEGRRGMVWIGNGLDGQFLRWNAVKETYESMTTENDPATGKPVEGRLMRVDFKASAVFPDGRWHASAIQDTRERKWWEAQKAEEAASMSKRTVVMIAIGLAAFVFFVLPKLNIGG